MKNKKIDKFLYFKFIITFVIVLVLVISIFSYVRNTNNNQEYEISVTTNEIGSVDILSEEDALNQESTIVTVTNENDADIDYKMYFIIDNRTSIDKSYIRVNYNGVTYDFSKMNYLEVGSKYYYYLEDGNILANSIDTFDSYIWIDSSFTGDSTNAKIYINFGTL